jgi:hypothetical protein
MHIISIEIKCYNAEESILELLSLHNYKPPCMQPDEMDRTSPINFVRSYFWGINIPIEIMLSKNEKTLMPSLRNLKIC